MASTKPPRAIAVFYYRFRREVKQQKYLHLESACNRAFTHMDQNKYEATTAEVVDLVTGEIYMTIYLTLEGNIHSLYGKGAKEKIREHRRVLRRRKEDKE